MWYFVWALGLGMGIGCISLSLYYRRPIIIAWSTPGAALLVSSLNGVDIQQATGIFCFVALLTLLTGISGWFNALVKHIPLPIAAAMLAGVLLQFGLGLFTSLQTQPTLLLSMFITYLLCKKWGPRYAIVGVLFVGFALAYRLQLISLSNLSWQIATPIWTTPSFVLSQLIGIGIPLFIVTMTSQNVPGVAILKSNGYGNQPVSPIISTTGVIHLLFAPFGGFAFNLAAITAAICTSHEAHPDPNKRYMAGVMAGIFNIAAGISAASVVAVMAVFPTALIAGLAGLALLGTLSNSLATATAQAEYREAAIMTFLFSASGVSFFGMAAAFWGIVAGMLTLMLTKR